MAEDQASSNEINEGSETPEAYDDDATTTVPVIEDLKPTTVPEDYEDETVPDYFVNLVVNEQNDGDVQLTTKIAEAAITDINGNVIPSKTSALVDTINEYVTTIASESSETTAITGGKGLWGWSLTKILVVALIAICILAILIALICLVLGKRKKGAKSAQTTSASSSKQAPSKGVSTDPKYQPVPNV